MRRATVCVLALAFAPTATASPFSLELRAPAPATFGSTVVLRGAIVPALVAAPVTILRDGVAIGTVATGPTGTFAFRTRAEGPGSYSATAGELAASAVPLAVRPRLVARVVGSGVVGRPLRLEARVEPAAPLRV